MKAASFFRPLYAIILIGLFLLSTPAFAQEDGIEGPSNRQVGLGVVAGANFPIANDQNYGITEAWGFYVDIPIISTFHIAPSTTLYRLDHKEDADVGNVGITDLSINFRFVIPFPMWHIFFHGLMGLSNGRFYGGDVIQMHVGAGMGFGVKIVSNLDFIALCQYKLIIDGDQKNINMIQPLAGLQFSF